MKYQILAGILGLVLILGLSPLPQAEAKMFLIDDFSNDGASPINQSGLCDLLAVSGMDQNVQEVTNFNATVLGVLGDFRDCKLTIDVSNSPSNAATDVVAPDDDKGPANQADMFRHMAGTGVESTTLLTYNANGAGLGISLLNSDDVKIVYSTSDFQVDITVRVTDSNGDWAEQQASTIAGTVSTPTNILFLITDFIDNPSAFNGVLNLGAIDEISFEYDTTVAFTDYDLDSLMITMEMVGGEMFPVDTTALLLAGAELNAIWILPLIVVIGIGAFVVSRKRN